jgi:hypothetical protein
MKNIFSVIPRLIIAHNVNINTVYFARYICVFVQILSYHVYWNTQMSDNVNIKSLNILLYLWKLTVIAILQQHCLVVCLYDTLLNY